MNPHRVEKKRNGGTVHPPARHEAAAADGADHLRPDQSAPIDPTQETAHDQLIKTLQEKATASHLKDLLHLQEPPRGRAGPDQERPKKPQRNPDRGHDHPIARTKNPKRANTERLSNDAWVVFCASNLSCKSL